MKHLAYTCLMFVALSSVEAEAADRKFLLSFAIFGGESGRMCAFAAAREPPPSLEAVANFHPSEVFSKAVCTHFSATWLPALPVEKKAEAYYESVEWSEASPDIPTYIPMVNM